MNVRPLFLTGAAKIHNSLPEDLPNHGLAQVHNVDGIQAVVVFAWGSPAAEINASVEAIMRAHEPEQTIRIHETASDLNSGEN